MYKNFDIVAYPVLSTIIDTLESSLHCSKFQSFSRHIYITTTDNTDLGSLNNKDIAGKGFGFTLTRSYQLGSFRAFIVLNISNCKQANLTENEITAVICHELGHLLNEPELATEPTIGYCFINEIEFSWKVLEDVQTDNCMQMEIFADAYARQHGYGKDLIATFHKQNTCFEQKIEYLDTRIEKLDDRKIIEGKVMAALFSAHQQWPF